MTQLPPEGISQSAWDEARNALSLGFTVPIASVEVCDSVARAIMAATERERERCALIAESKHAEETDDEPWSSGWRVACNNIAAAIRQGSQPSNAIPLKGVVR